MSHGTASATVGTTNTAAAARYAAADSTSAVATPAQPAHAQHRAGAARRQRARRRPPGRAGDQRPGQGSAPRGAHRGVVGEQLDQQLHRAQRVGAADQPREGGVHRGERLQNQVVTGPQVSPLVGEDGRDFGVGERVQRPFADHHPAAHTRQAVGKRLRDVQDAKIARPGARLGERRIVSDPDQIDHHAVVGPPSPIRDGHPDHGDHQSGADQHGQREDARCMPPTAATRAGRRRRRCWPWAARRDRA